MAGARRVQGLGSDGGRQRGEIEAGKEGEREDVGRALENTRKKKVREKTDHVGRGLAGQCVCESEREKEEQKEFSGGI